MGQGKGVHRRKGDIEALPEAEEARTGVGRQRGNPANNQPELAPADGDIDHSLIVATLVDAGLIRKLVVIKIAVELGQHDIHVMGNRDRVAVGHHGQPDANVASRSMGHQHEQPAVSVLRIGCQRHCKPVCIGCLKQGAPTGFPGGRFVYVPGNDVVTINPYVLVGNAHARSILTYLPAEIVEELIGGQVCDAFAVEVQPGARCVRGLPVPPECVDRAVVKAQDGMIHGCKRTVRPEQIRIEHVCQYEIMARMEA